jgi:spermidine synthase
MTLRSNAAQIPSPYLLPLILLLFLGSGCAALIYEIVWFQLLELVIGSSAISLAVLLGTFMGGLFIGSIALPRVVSNRAHPLRVYVILELGIGAMGLAIVHLMPWIAGIYASLGGEGVVGLGVRAIVCVACLLPPTILMGATLPAVARWVESTPTGMSWLGLFYGGNTVGAVGGCLLAGFFLLPNYDMAVATYVAVAINAAVGALALVLSVLARHIQPISKETLIEPGESGGGAVYVAIALSGMAALGAEVIWTRLMSLLLGPTVYAFSVILAVFLVGLAIGSTFGAMVARSSDKPRRSLGWCQLLAAGAIIWAAFSIDQCLPQWPISADAINNLFTRVQIDLARCIWVVLPAAILWGASFPLALAGVAGQGRDSGRVVGGIYAANTIGAILGALGFALIFIPSLGTQDSQRVLIVLSGVAALLVFVPPVFASLAMPDVGETQRRSFAFADLALSVVTFVGVGTAAWFVPETPWQLIANGPEILRESNNGSRMLYVGEGMNSSVAVTKSSDGAINFHVSGKIEASTEPLDMRLQVMLGHLPAMVHPHPKSVLIIGCGAGVTAGCFVQYPEIEHIVICDIEPLIPQNVADFFKEQNHDVVHDPRVTIVYDDARHFVSTSKEKFDIITSDPIHPWVKGSATLYTSEYFQICKDHLNPGGLVTQWVPLYQSSTEVIKCEFATFFQAFPGGTIWSNDSGGTAYDLVLMGGKDDEPKIDVDAMSARWDQPDHIGAAGSLEAVGFRDALSLLETYEGQGSDVKPWLVGAQINRDINLRLQFMAGLAMNLQSQQDIFNGFSKYREFPDNLFTGAQGRLDVLRRVIGEKPGK